MINIQGIGCPFTIEHSSCSTMVPKSFKWSSLPQDIQVFIDGGIFQGLKTPYHDKKYAWICESRFIGSAKDIRNILLRDKEQILSKFKYLFTCEKELCKLDSRIKWTYAGSNLPWCFGRNYSCFMPIKTKLVSMICSPKEYSEGHRYRLSIAKELQNKLDLYGGAFNSIRPGEGSGAHRDKAEAIDHYMFSVVFENDSYSGYFTEKITDCFARGTIPIYYGDPEICKHFDCDGIISYSTGILDTLTPELYYSKQNALKNNMQIILNMPTSEDYFVQEYIAK
jgi:hypothetical protein